ncbi:hypothetical protein T484DRAFT_1803293, partial [Baffinella frigidus]
PKPATGLADTGPKRVFPVLSPAALRKTLPVDKDVVAFQNIPTNKDVVAFQSGIS